MAPTEYGVEFVMELEKRRVEAMVANDVTRLGPLLDEQLTYIHSSAVKDSRHEYLGSIREGHLAYRDCRPDYAQIVSLGPRSFLVNGRVALAIELDGRPFQLDNLFVAVWKAGDDGEWRLISWQSTPVPT